MSSLAGSVVLCLCTSRCCKIVIFGKFEGDLAGTLCFWLIIWGMEHELSLVRNFVGQERSIVADMKQKLLRSSCHWIPGNFVSADMRDRFVSSRSAAGSLAFLLFFFSPSFFGVYLEVFDAPPSAPYNKLLFTRKE